ncbi:ras-related protein Rap1-like [Montipora capricornis]|uniref:ras-related protein Rap1-like n=1 Tax=Montipora capricornis TaxID=246305 RepID=UPI0035F1CA14
MLSIEEGDSFDPPVYFKKFTIAVFGDSGVGKSSIVRLLVSDEHITEHEPTVEDFYVKQMTHRNKAYELHLIDTSGTYEFPAMRRIAMEKADAAVLVYSLDKPSSFLKLDRYMQEITKCCDDRNRKIPVIIVSNKSDLPNLSEPTFHNSYGLKISACVHLEGKWKCLWLATSAKFNLNVDTIFHKLLDKLSPEKNVPRKKTSLMKQILRN